MLIETTQIVFGPGRFLEVGSIVDFPPAEAVDLINAGKARAVGAAETAALTGRPENAMRPPHNQPRPRPQKRGS